tara:strand:- start:655 stop:1122 length:468 start_codon:yes stop_codon:yes gene_type:complete
MKSIAKVISGWSDVEISSFEKENSVSFMVDGESIVLNAIDVEIITTDIPGWKIASSGDITIALDVSISQELKEEGLARDFVNKVQNLRKDLDLNVTDTIKIKILSNSEFKSAINNNLNYICSETLTKKLVFVDELENAHSVDDNKESAQFSIIKV